MNDISIIQVTKQDLFDFLDDISKQRSELMNSKRYLTSKEAQQMTGKTRATLFLWQKKGYLIPSRIGKELRYLESDILELMSRKRGKDE